MVITKCMIILSKLVDDLINTCSKFEIFLYVHQLNGRIWKTKYKRFINNIIIPSMNSVVARCCICMKKKFCRRKEKSEVGWLLLFEF